MEDTAKRKKTAQWCHHCHPRTGWVDENILHQCVENMWNRWLSALFKKFMLVWDMFNAHLVDSMKEQLKKNRKNTHAVEPEGCTSLLQPLDVCLNMKCRRLISSNRNHNRHFQIQCNHNRLHCKCKQNQWLLSWLHKILHKLWSWESNIMWFEPHPNLEWVYKLYFLYIL